MTTEPNDDLESEPVESTVEVTNLTDRHVDLSRPSGSHPIRKLIFLLVGILLIAVVGYGIYLYKITTSQIIESDNETGFFGQIHRIIDEDVQPLRGEEDDRVNILLLGRGGLNHPGGTLVDTIMVASYKPSSNQVSLLSLPRDLVLPVYPNPDSDYFEYRKINYTVELGGIELAKEKVKEVTGLDIHYYIMADFSGFRDVIDTLGGLDVTVENTFTDYQYPDYNYGYQTISFQEGVSTLSGEKALQFARSRHGNNGEGSDFARARRQQIILESFRDKALSASTILNPSKISGVLSDVGNHVEVDMEIWELSRFASIAQHVNKDEIINKVVDNGLSGLVYSEISSETGAYVLVPRAGLGDFSEINQLALNVFESGIVMQEHSVVAVQNGTSIEGLAGRTATVLEGAGIEVNGITNAVHNNVPHTVVYNLSSEDKTSTVATIEEQLGVTVLKASLPSSSESAVRLSTDVDPSIVDISALPEHVDFIIVLGNDQDRATVQTAVTDGDVNAL